MNILFSFMVATILFGHVTSRSIDVSTVKGQWEYLEVHGHALKLPAGQQPNPQQLQAAIRDFQRFFKLEVTGFMNPETYEVMQWPRCGSSDNNLPVAAFTLGDDKWGKSQVTWSLNTVEPGVDRNRVRKIIGEALQAWQMYVKPKITEAPQGYDGDIRISFLTSDSGGEHGDGYPFYDHTVAHAFYPGSRDIAGDVHFNLKKEFSYSDNVPYNVYSVKFIAVHELGHALGLDHSGEKYSVMYPLVKRGVNFITLHPDDIAGMLTRYGNFISGSSKNAKCGAPLVLVWTFITFLFTFWNNNKLL